MGVDLGPEEIHFRQPLLPLLLRYRLHEAGDLPGHVVEALAEQVDFPGPRMDGNRGEVSASEGIHGTAQAH